MEEGAYGPRYFEPRPVPRCPDPTGLLGGVTDDFEEDGFGVGLLVRHLLGRPEQLMGLVGGDLPVLP